MLDFDTVKGHEDIIRVLKNSIVQKQVSHAYIFDGMEGVGKRTLAKAFAKSLQCEKGGAMPCGECESCRSFENGTNPDVFYIEREKKNMTVDIIREDITRRLETAPYSNKYKIFIVNEGDTMNEAAQNAFLKTLEEPPEYAVFIILCRNFARFIATVLSRCIIFKLHPLSYETVAEFVAKEKGIPLAEALVYAKYSSGSIGKALSFIDDEEFKEKREYAFSLVDNIEKASDINTVCLLSEDLSKRGDVSEIFDIIYMIYRDCLVYKATGSVKRLIQTEKKDFIVSLAKAKSYKSIANTADAIGDTLKRISYNADVKLVSESLFLKMKEK
ncbi:MAG: DNA polymerase III subunit delta' [Firmicutes bacterium]|nr:DNA polymerase III subunit delta' [Bacillota bacterium]